AVPVPAQVAHAVARGIEVTAHRAAALASGELGQAIVPLAGEVSVGVARSVERDRLHALAPVGVERPVRSGQGLAGRRQLRRGRQAMIAIEPGRTARAQDLVEAVPVYDRQQLIEARAQVELEARHVRAPEEA